MVAEEDVDIETLQAQIDMSMSFAHDLVTSWIGPTHLARLVPDVNATHILEEELHRPPRLGVGGSIPMVSPLAHVASKLKRKLGKNGANNDGVVESQPQDSSRSDDDEYKGRPARRKTKVDPFGHEGSKKEKRKADSEVNRYHFVEISLPDNSTLKEPRQHNLSSGKGTNRSGTLIHSPSPTVPSLSKSSRETHATPEPNRIHTNSMPMSNKANPLGVPLLNLDGPPKLTDKLANTDDSNNSRRKRKRRKKKRAQMVAGVGDNPH